MFAYNPNLAKPQAVNVNTSADSAQVNNSLSNVLDTLSQAQKQRNFNNTAEAKVKAAQVANNNKVLAAKVNQSYTAENLRSQFENASKLSTQKWGQDSKTAKVLNDNKVKAEALKVETNRDLQNTISNNALFNQTLQNEEARKVAKTKAETDVKLAKIKNIGSSKVSSADRNKLVKEIDELGGLDKMINQTVDDLDDANLFFDFDLSDQSKKDLKSSITAIMLDNPDEGLKFRLNRKKYIEEFMKEYGTRDDSYLPFTNDEWIPNTDAMLIQKKLNDVKRLRGE